MISQFRLNLFEKDRLSRQVEEAENAYRRRAEEEVKDPKQRREWLAGMNSAFGISRRIIGNSGDPWESGTQRLALQAISAAPLYSQGLLSPWQILLPLSGLACDRGKLGYLDAQLKALEKIEKSDTCKDDSELCEALEEEKKILSESRAFTNTQANVRIMGLAFSTFAVGTYFAWCGMKGDLPNLEFVKAIGTSVGSITNMANMMLYLWNGCHQNQEHSVRAESILANLTAGSAFHTDHC